jgi:hypothetical protein
MRYILTTPMMLPAQEVRKNNTDQSLQKNADTRGQRKAPAKTDRQDTNGYSYKVAGVSTSHDKSN